MSKTVIGIDPGKMGGIASVKKDWPYAVSMPPTLPQINAYIKDLRANSDDIIAFIEKVQIFDKDEETPGKKYGIKKLLESYDQLKACLTFHDIPFVEVYPQSWQSALQLNVPKGSTKTDRKNIYKNYISKIFPQAKSNLNTADALCIAYFGIQKLKFDPGWVRQRVTKRNEGLF